MKGILMSFAMALVAINVLAQEIKITLSNDDQRLLTDKMAKLPPEYRSEEVINQDSFSWYVLRKYSFLDENSAFNIQCSEKFIAGSAVGTDSTCSVGFNYTNSDPTRIVSHDGFMPAFAIAELKGDFLAKALYSAMEPEAFFCSKEQVAFTHPATGNKFNAFRLRIDCKSDEQSRNYSCLVSAVK
ncbi:MAG: hypothetical protein ACXVCP_11085 [Bdellovibrio sp.]